MNLFVLYLGFSLLDSSILFQNFTFRLRLYSRRIHGEITQKSLIASSTTNLLIHTSQVSTRIYEIYFMRQKAIGCTKNLCRCRCFIFHHQETENDGDVTPKPIGFLCSSIHVLTNELFLLQLAYSLRKRMLHILLLL